MKCFLLAFLFGCQAQSSATQMPRPAGRGAEPARLCLELHATREHALLGEPLSLVATLMNCSAVTQQVEDLLPPEYGFLQVWIQPPDGKEVLYRPAHNRNGRGKPPRTLAPGGRLSAFVPVHAGADGWTMTRPGRYRFRAQYSIDGPKLESKSVAVTVAPPQTDADRQVAAIIMSREVSRFVASGIDENGAASSRLAAAVEKYPRSRLAPHTGVWTALAENRGRFDPATKTFREERCAPAVEQLARAVPAVADPSVAAAGAAFWIRCLRRLGREKEVNGVVTAFLRSHPTARDVTEVQALHVGRQE